MELSLDREETIVLNSAIQRKIRSLMREMARTDARSFRDALKAEEEILEGIKAKMSRLDTPVSQG